MIQWNNNYPTDGVSPKEYFKSNTTLVGLEKNQSKYLISPISGWSIKKYTDVTTQDNKQQAGAVKKHNNPPAGESPDNTF